MRVDLALKYLCLAKSRSGVKQLCDSESLLINDRPAKASATLHDGDRVTIRYPHRTLTVEVRSVPEKQLSRAAAAEHYIKLSETGAADADGMDF